METHQNPQLPLEILVKIAQRRWACFYNKHGCFILLSGRHRILGGEIQLVSQRLK